MANTDFVKFNAYSIKDLINQKLAQDTNFTDQIYEGSNLAVLIDIFSYIAHSLLYCLNTAAAESMFADTQMYENMNRLCRFIGYNPKGMSPSTARFIPYPTEDTASVLSTAQYFLRYSYVDTGKTDSQGKSIYYSIGDDDVHDFNWNSDEFTMYNGIWRMYGTVFVATGTEWETFTLDKLRSNFPTNEFIAHNFMNVFAVEYYTEDDEERGIKRGSIKSFRKFRPTQEQLFKIPLMEYNDDEKQKVKNMLFSGRPASGILHDKYEWPPQDKNVYDKSSQVFNIRLNENKEYQITFGDGSTGAKLPEGASIYVIYFDSNGLEAEISPGEVNAQLQMNNFGATTELMDAILLGANDTIFDEMVSGYYFGPVVNVSPNTVAALEETVNDIRENAPNWFRMGNRLVTHNDYEYYIKNHPVFRGRFVDVVCMNNWEYISSFYKWLYTLGVMKHNDPKYFLNQNRLIKNDFQIADPADCNNIYLWCLESGASGTGGSGDDMAIDRSGYLKDVLRPIKDMTHEPTFLRAIPVSFIICAAPADEMEAMLQENVSVTEMKDFIQRSFIEITLDDDSLYSSSSIQKQVISRIITYFMTENQRLGQIENFNDIMNSILDIDGVNKIRTVYYPLDPETGKEDPNSAIIYNGLCFASYSVGHEGLIDIGADLEVSNSSRSLEKFQYGQLDTRYINERVKVIKKSLASMNRVQY